MSQMIEENLAEYQLAMGRCFSDASMDASIVDDDTTLWVAADSPFPMYNGVFRSNFSESNIASKIEEVQEQFRKRKVPMTWMLGPSSKPDNLAQHLVANGFTHYEDEPGMCLDMRSVNQSFAAPDGFQIRVVESDDELQEWVSVWSFDSKEIVPELLAIHRGFSYRKDAPWRYYVGLQHGKPVATSLLFRGSSAAAVHWVVTIPEARHQGIGAIMTLAAVRDAHLEGYRYAILTASPMGEGIYRRIGFQPYCTISKYTWTP